jgi:hypothetical protein
LIWICLIGAPNLAWAEVCDKQRPNWDGAPVSPWSEMLALFQTPLAIFLILTTALAVRLRNQWLGLAVVVGWSSYTMLMTTTGIRGAAIVEGCVGQPTLFIGAIAALCVAVVLYTAPLPKRRG